MDIRVVVVHGDVFMGYEKVRTHELFNKLTKAHRGTLMVVLDPSFSKPIAFDDVKNLVEAVGGTVEANRTSGSRWLMVIPSVGALEEPMVFAAELSRYYISELLKEDLRCAFTLFFEL